MKITICIPVYNSESTIEKLVSEIGVKLASYDLEFLLVNDGSSDKSEMICTGLAKNNSRVRFISLARNFGEHNAVMCALNFASGDCAVIIDDDFQNPPSEIIHLVNELSLGYDVVYSKYLVKHHNCFRNLGSWFHNRLSTYLLDKPSKLYLSSFKVINRRVINEIIKYSGPFPYIDGLILRSTNNISSVLVDHSARQDGVSNYTFGKLVSLWLNMFINFSIKPLRIFTFLGMAVSLISGVAIIYLIGLYFLDSGVAPGWTSVIVAISFFSGLQIIFLGLISEYIGKNYLTSTRMPQWVIKHSKL